MKVCLTFLTVSIFFETVRNGKNLALYFIFMKKLLNGKIKSLFLCSIDNNLTDGIRDFDWYIQIINCFNDPKDNQCIAGINHIVSKSFFC